MNIITDHFSVFIKYFWSSPEWSKHWTSAVKNVILRWRKVTFKRLQIYIIWLNLPIVYFLFLCVRYPNLDFGWKRSIDSKTFISCADSCCGGGDRPCKHQESESPDYTSLTHPNSHHSSCEPGEAGSTRNLMNGTARVNCVDNGHQDEHLHRHDNCKCSQCSTIGLQSPESIQSTTSVPVQPAHSFREPSSCPPLPSDECSTRRTSDHIIKTTSVCSWAASAPRISTAQCFELPNVCQHRSQAGDSLKSLGPNPGLILQALTLSNASDGFNLERLEMLGDSFLKHAITTYLFCTYPDAHEGRLSYMRSKKVRKIKYHSFFKVRRNIFKIWWLLHVAWQLCLESLCRAGYNC